MRQFDRDLQPAVYNNVSPAMAQVLADELGVRPAALRKLGLGFLPVVEFKKGFNYEGQWTFPERDSTGRIVGLGLRNRIDGSRKTMFPGSKRGLYYAADDRLGTGSAEHGSTHWVRVSDAGVDCPICGKPDWCLVDADDPEDPAAAICPRVPSGRDLGEAGYLHILDRFRSKGLVDDEVLANPLPDSTDPVIVVEGPTDTAAVLSLGLVAVGRPSAGGGLTVLPALCRGRRVVVVGENDEKKDGSWPGRFGAEKTLKALEALCPNARVVFPPAVFKDVRQWVVGTGLSREAFMEHVDKYAATSASALPSSSALPDDNISTVANAVLEKLYTADGRPTIVRCEESWYNYGAGGWSEESTRESVRNEIHRFLAESHYREVNRHTQAVVLTPFNPTTFLIRNVSQHLGAIVPNPPLPPAWLDGRTSPRPDRLLCFANGTIEMDEYLRGNRSLAPYTSDLFVTYRLPFDYDADAECPRWDGWLQETLGDDPNKIALLQEWFGYNLVADNRYEKMLLMLGQRRSGKGTALTAMQALLGPAAEATSLKAFGSGFGLHHLIGKLAAVMPDAITPNQGQQQCLHTLLEIIGNDRVRIDRKFKDAITALLKCRVTIAANLLPNLPDESLALSARTMILQFNESFLGREETGLKRYLLQNEMPGIMLWALEGLERLTKAGVFTLPKDAAKLEDDFTNLVCPIAEFAETWVFACPSASVTLDELFEAWKTYSEERRGHIRTKQWLYDRLKVRYPQISRHSNIEAGKTVKTVTGIDLHGFAPNARNHRS